MHNPFWRDVWLGSTSLAAFFPTLFRILCNRDEKLRDFLFTRSLYDWEKERLAELRNTLDVSGVAATLDRPDQMIWQDCPSGKFSAKSIYNLAASSTSNHAGQSV